MGEVLEAVRTGPGGFRMPVALKRLAADQALRGDMVQRFFAEARILARLDHPNIVRVHDVLSVDAGYFIVMELLRGVTLAEVAAHRGDRTPWPEVLAVADQALAGLAYAHAASDERGAPLGLVHRDVTPRNLFVTDTGQVKLLDFGIAKLHERLEAPITREGTVHGTLELLSPEQAAGETADGSSDLYQLGASMYWALAARYPHGSGSAPELLARIIAGVPRPLAGLRPDLPAQVVALIERAMTRERSARFGSAAHMRDQVSALLAPTGVGAAQLARAVRDVRDAQQVAPPAEGTSHPAPTESMTRTGPATPAALATTVVAASDGGPRHPRRRRRLAVFGAASALGGVLWLARGGPDAPGREVREVMLTQTVGDQQPMGGGVSRDGERLVYADGARLLVRPLAGGRVERQATPPGLSPADAEFTADDQILVFGQHRSGDWQLWRLGSAGFALLHWAPDRYLTRVAPDGKSIACAHDEREVELLVPGQTARRLLELSAGEIVGGMAWSPDGARLAVVIMDPAGGDDRIDIVDVSAPVPTWRRLRTMHRTRFASYVGVLVAWPQPDRMVYALNDRRGATLHSLDMSTGVESAVHRWAGLSVTGGRWGGGRLLCYRGTHRYGIFVAERGQPMRRLSTGDGATRRLAGWSGQGWLFYATDAAGNFDIVGHPPSDQPALWMSGDGDEMPDTLVDGALLFQRSPGAGGPGTIDLWRSSAPGDAQRMISVQAAGLSANAIRCAGDSRAPCVIEEVDDGQARYLLFDPARGTRGREITAVPARGNYQRNMALAPDGETLALVAGGDAIALFDVDSGRRRDLPVAGMTALQSISWSVDGRQLLVTGVGWRGHMFAALRVGLDGSVAPIESGQSRWYWRVQESPDGSQMAMVASDFAMDLAVLEGI
jgi:tRNA A-37 threonylcarbamoyl transferase component Bud32